MWCRILRWLVWTVAALLTAAAPAAATPLVGVAVPTCLLPAAPGMTAAALFAAPGRFDCATRQKRYPPGNYWVLSAPLPDRPIAKVRMASVWQSRATLHVLYADGVITRTRYASTGTGALLRNGATVELPVAERPARAVRLLWHIEGAANLRGIVVGAAVASQEESARAELVLGIFYAFFAGVIGALLIHNLALLAALRQQFQIAYCTALGLILCYATSTSGLLGRMLPGLDNNDRLRINALLLTGGAAAILLFARYFFERRVFAGPLRVAIHAVIASLVTSGLLFALLAPWQIRMLDRMMVASYVAMIVLVPFVLVQAWRRRSDYLWLFAFGWGVPIVTAILRIAHALGLIRWQFWLDQSTIVSMGVEALLSSIAIAYRLRMLQRERDEAREREREARDLAATDPLTGLLNRRAFLDRAIRRGGVQTLLIVDVDHFKAVNATIGHDGGDEVLRSIARALAAAVPASALVARIGGEEFAVAAPVDAELSGGGVLAALRGTRMPFDVAVTSSIGTCTGPLSGEAEWKALYRAADHALYAAKEAGRDRARDAGRLPLAA